jgi:hypothetical protein
MSDVYFEPPLYPGAYYSLLSGAAGQFYPAGSSLTPGADGILNLAIANLLQPAKFAGLLVYPVTIAEVGEPELSQVIVSGAPLTLTEAQWNLVVEGGGALITGATYYVSADVPGKIAAVPPSATGTYLSQVGYALSATTMLVTPAAIIGPHA